MSEQTQQIQTEEKPIRHYVRIPHIADDYLTMEEYRLYGHYRRRADNASGNGKCNEKIETTARHCGMGIHKTRQARNGLKSKGFIDFVSHGGTLIVTILDIWERNQQYFADGVLKIDELEQIRNDQPVIDPEKSRLYAENTRKNKKENQDVTNQYDRDDLTNQYDQEPLEVTDVYDPTLQISTPKNNVLEQPINTEEQQGYHLPNPLLLFGLKTQPQPEPTPNAAQAPKATGQSNKEASSARAISKRTKQPLEIPPALKTPMPPELEGYKAYSGFLQSIPLDWTWTHIYIYQAWYHPDWKKAAYQTRIDAVTEIYKAVSTKTQETPLTTLTMASYVDWYYEQDWVIREARKKGMSTPRDWNLPKPDNLASSLADWQPTRLPAYTPREHTAPPKRGNVFSRGGGV